MNFDKPFWRNVLRESDGTPSSSRLFVAGIVAEIMVLMAYLTVKNNAFPDLVAVATFVAITSGALYGVNKISTAAVTIFGKGSSE